LPRELMLRAAREQDAAGVRGALGARGFRSVYATVPIGAVDIAPSRVDAVRDPAV